MKNKTRDSLQIQNCGAEPIEIASPPHLSLRGIRSSTVNTDAPSVVESRIRQEKATVTLARPHKLTETEPSRDTFRRLPDSAIVIVLSTHTFNNHFPSHFCCPRNLEHQFLVEYFCQNLRTLHIAAEACGLNFASPLLSETFGT